MSYWLWYLCESCKYHSFVHFLLCLLHNMSSHYSHSYFHFGTSITFSKATCNTLSLLITIISSITTISIKNTIPISTAIVIVITTTTKWLSVGLRTKWLWFWIPLLSLKRQISRLFRARSSLTFEATMECRFTLKCVRDLLITHICIIITISFTHTITYISIITIIIINASTTIIINNTIIIIIAIIIICFILTTNFLLTSPPASA